MSTRPDFDHTSFAVGDALVWARRLRRELGATPIAGEALPEFRYLLLHVGTALDGSRIEFIEPAADGFVSRFLDRHGEGPHHLTFTVPDLRASVDQVHGLGLHVTGESYSHAAWREAFIGPDAVHRVVIQLAQSDAAYPSPAELLATTERDVDSFPSTAGATDKTWWTPVWDTAPGATAVAGATHIVTTDLALSRRLFEGVLGGEAHEVEAGLEFRWPHGSVRAVVGSTPGISAMGLTDGPTDEIAIGPVRLGSTTTKGPDT